MSKIRLLLLLLSLFVLSDYTSGDILYLDPAKAEIVLGEEKPNQEFAFTTTVRRRGPAFWHRQDEVTFTSDRKDVLISQIKIHNADSNHPAENIKILEGGVDEADVKIQFKTKIFHGYVYSVDIFTYRTASSETKTEKDEEEDKEEDEEESNDEEKNEDTAEEINDEDKSKKKDGKKKKDKEKKKGKSKGKNKKKKSEKEKNKNNEDNARIKDDWNSEDASEGDACDSQDNSEETVDT